MDAPLLLLSVIQFDVKGDEGRREEENKRVENDARRDVFAIFFENHFHTFRKEIKLSWTFRISDLGGSLLR